MKFTSLSDKELTHTIVREAVRKGILPDDAIDLLLKDEASREDKQKALAKLIRLNGDSNKLTANERALLEGKLTMNTKNSETLSEAIDIKIIKEINTIQQISDKEEKKLEALEKLKQNNGDNSKLTQDEKQLIKIEIEKSTNEDGEIDANKLEEIIKYTKTTQIYNEEEKSEKIGKYYEDKG